MITTKFINDITRRIEANHKTLEVTMIASCPGMGAYEVAFTVDETRKYHAKFVGFSARHDIWKISSDEDPTHGQNYIVSNPKGELLRKSERYV